MFPSICFTVNNNHQTFPLSSCRGRSDVQTGDLWKPGEAGDDDVGMLRSIGGPGLLWSHQRRRLHLERHDAHQDHQSPRWPRVRHVLPGQGNTWNTWGICLYCSRVRIQPRSNSYINFVMLLK